MLCCLMLLQDVIWFGCRGIIWHDTHITRVAIHNIMHVRINPTEPGLF